MRRLLLVLFLAASLLSAGYFESTQTTSPNTVSQSFESEFSLNTSVHPGDDFYAYVNDAWIAEHPIPADKRYYSALTEIGDRVNDDLHTLLEEAAKASPESADRNITLLGRFYRSGMDTDTIEREELDGVSDLLTAIDAVDSRDDLTDITVVLLAQGFPPVHYYWAETNPENSSETIPGLYQAGKGAPDPIESVYVLKARYSGE